MIETKRLRMRKLTAEDLPWLVEMRSPDAVNRYLGGIRMQNAEALARRMQSYIDCYEKFGFGFCAMELKATGELIGTSGLQPLEDTGEIEVGYNMSEKYWRQGYGHECAIEWLTFGFETVGLERIVAVAHPDNTGSWRIMEKCGMSYQKIDTFYGMQCVYYAITSSEWNKRQPQPLPS